MPNSSRKNSKQKANKPLNILLSNGRFPVTLDLARQLHLTGHHIYVVDPMHYHVCKFSNVVKRSYRVPAPYEDPDGYIEGVKCALEAEKIDLLIPMHEEIFFLAAAAETIHEIRKVLFAPPMKILITLHSKWEFSKYLSSVGLDVPKTQLCKSYEDILNLDHNTEWALKPVFGRASTNVYHLRPGEPRPKRDEIKINDEIHFVAQEWLYGDRYCSYSVLQDGKVAAYGIYPVKDTIDGSSCVYFESVEQARISDYIDRLAEHLSGVSGQLAFDFIEIKHPYRLVAIECNPRATAGIHLFSRTPDLALAMTCRSQLAPGMLMWKRTKTDRNTKSALKQYLLHVKRLTCNRDVIFSSRDLIPSLMQPFLLTSYYEICREKKLQLPTMFQHDLTWEPKGEDLQRVRKILIMESIHYN
ncbi:hypothetical protein BDQ17DRAFT_1390651 [Cyathus striatus]|nr:hypothetical protein BDQ17DRAFT_1390651 [Cyathus striatus]